MSAEIARLVAEHWHRALKEDHIAARHVLGLVLAALDGQTDPEHLGIEPGPTADAIIAAGRVGS